MILGGYRFKWDPDKHDIPKPEKLAATKETYTTFAYWSWGTTIIGKVIPIEFDWVTAEQFLVLQRLLESDSILELDFEYPDKIYYGNPIVNLPFETERVITGQTSGATATISAKNTPNRCLTLSSILGTFGLETIIDNSDPAKSATITALHIIPNYNVQFLFLDGNYFDLVGPDLDYRQTITATVKIIEEA